MNDEYKNKLAVKNRLTQYYLDQSVKNGLASMEKL